MTKSLRRLGMAVAVGAAASAFSYSAAFAGGWAITTLDPLTPPQAGQTTAVGFTIRQHGVTPVIPDSGEIAIAIRAADGAQQLFAARSEGPVGHFVADVTFPSAGEYTWEVRQGWFAPQDLGAITIASAAGTSNAGASATAGTSAAGTSNAGTSATAGASRDTSTGASSVEREYRWPLSARLIVPMLGLALAAIALFDGRRRPRPSAIEPAS